MDIGSFGSDSDGRIGSGTISDISIASEKKSDPNLSASHCRRVKFMCSCSGKILPRPSDRKFRYVGGQTRMISVPRNISYAAFLHKMMDIYVPGFTLKYQLPEEDLDALVSVSTDEDFDNMMEECDRLEALDGASRLRMFAFAPSDLDATDLSDISDPKSVEQKYVEAVNEASATENSARKHEDPTFQALSKKSDELDINSWDANPSEFSRMEIFTPSVTDPKNSLCWSNQASLLMSPAAAAAGLSPLSCYMSNLGASSNNSLDASAAGEVLLDLECPGSRNSSTSSQHDTVNQCAHYQSSQLQSAQESWSNSSGKHACMAEFRFSKEVGTQAGDSCMPPLTSIMVTLPLQTPSVFQEPPFQIQREIISPSGIVREKHLDTVQGMLTDHLIGAFQPSIVNHEFGQQVFKQQHSLREHPRQVVEASLVKVVPPCSGPAQEISDNAFLTSSAETPLINLAELHYESLYNQDSGTENGVTWVPCQPVLLERSSPVLPESSGMFHPQSWQVKAQKSSEDLQIPATLFPGQSTMHNCDIGAARGASCVATQQLACSHSGLEKLPASTALKSVTVPMIVSTDTVIKSQIRAQPLDVNLTTTSPSLGDVSAVALASNLLQPHHLSEHILHEASSVGNSTTPSIDSLLDLHQGEHIVISVGEATMRNSAESHMEPLHDLIILDEDTSFVCGEDVQPRAGMPIEFGDNTVLVRSGDETLVSVSAVGASEASLTALLSQAIFLDTPFLETEHDQLRIDERSVREAGDSDLSVNEDLAEELDTFDPINDRSINVAAVAQAEAIVLGLQTIRNFDLEELRELGSGTFGTVYHGKWRGTDVAIKRIKSSVFTGRSSERERLLADFWREAHLLGQLHHPNVVAFYGIVPDGPGGTLATVTEYMVNGSLKQVLIKNERALDYRKRLLIAMDAAFGMEYLHGKNVVHFDMKCENLLVNLRDAQRPICKISDLGLSKVKQKTMVSGGVRGTLPWMAPELLNGSSSLVSEKVDVFSFGIVLWELLTGEEPYADMHYGAIIGGIVSNTLRPPVPQWCDPVWRSLMERCWSVNPSERPTFSEIAASLRAMEVSFRQIPHTA